MENMKGTWCPYDDIFCQEGYCDECLVYLEYEKKLAEKIREKIRKKNHKKTKKTLNLYIYQIYFYIL